VVITAAGITMMMDMGVQRMVVITAAAGITMMVDMEVHPAPLSVK